MLFGHSVDQALEEGEISAEDVVDLLKLFLFPEYTADGNGPVGQLMKQIRAQHDTLINKIQSRHKGKVLYKEKLEDREWGSGKVKNMEDVVVAYLKFILHNTLLEIAHEMGVAAKENDGTFVKLRQIFEQESHVAVSVPTMWSRTTRDNFLKLLGRAGFPSSTATIPEAVSAGVGHFNCTSNLKDEKGKPVNMIVADIGGATFDVAGVRKYFQSGSARFGEIVKQKGSFHGSIRLNMLMVKHLAKIFGRRRLRSVHVNLGWTAEKWSQNIRDGFENTKRSFDNTEDTYIIKLPGLSQAQEMHHAMNDDEVPECELTLEGLVVGREVVKAIFDEWLDEIVKIIRQSQDEFKNKYQNALAPLLALCGWGSLPPYVLQKCKVEFRGNKVTLIEKHKVPLIAQGNVVTLLRADLFFDVPARYSYGIRVDMLWEDVDKEHQEYQELLDAQTEDGYFLPDRALWLVRKGESLIGPKGLFFKEGHTRATAERIRQRFPFVWEIDVLSSSHVEVHGSDKYGAVSRAIEAGRIRVVGQHSMKIDKRSCKITPHPAYESFNEPAYIEFDFRMRVDFNTICPKMIISIPAEGGEFKEPLDENWTEKPDDCHKVEIEIGLLHDHTTSQGNKDAKLDANPDMDDEDEESGTED